jgi:hypothetical protein
MQGSQKSNMPSDENRTLGVNDMKVAEPYVDRELAVNQIIAQVEWMVAEFGDPERAAGFDSREFVNRWIESHIPALGGKPSRLLGTNEGRAQIQMVLNCSWSGAYA